LRVVTVPMVGRASGYACLYVRSGSRYEVADEGGVSHFVEHMLFRGQTGDPDGRRMIGVLEAAGGTLDAGTTRDHVYYATPFPAGDLEAAVAAIAQLVCAPLFSRRAMALERRIVLEEILDEYDAAGRDISLENLARRTILDDHPLAAPIAGTPSTVQGLRREQLVAHHAHHYRPDQMVLCVAGPVESTDVLSLAERRFESLAPSDGAPVVARPVDSPRFGTFGWVDHEASLTSLRWSYPGVLETDPDYPAQQALLLLLDDGFASRLPRALVEERGLLYRVAADLDAYADVSFFEIDAACGPERVAAAVRALASVLQSLCDDGPDPAELERVRRRWRAHIRYGLDAAPTLAAWLGGVTLFREAPAIEERLSLLDPLSVEDLKRVARRIVGQRPSVAAVGRLTTSARRALERAATG